ncbi:MAG: UDP-glucose 4-epimerase family protein [Gammaproteobacteria bacterium]
MRVLVTGANGFIGRAMCLALKQSGASVCAMVRKTSSDSDRDFLPTVDEMVTAGDLSAVKDWRRALEGIDAVVHLAARAHVLKETAADPLSEYRRTNVQTTKRLALAAADAGVSRFVFLSSIGVNGNSTTSSPFSETDTPNPVTPYAVSKWEAENSLRDIHAKTALEVVIVRPPLVYGPGVKGNFLRLLEWISKGYLLPFGRVNNHRSLVYLGNLVDALLACLVHDRAPGKIFLVNDDEALSTADLIHALGFAMNTPTRLLPVPVKLLNLLGSALGKSADLERLFGSLVVDGGFIRNQLGWAPRYAVADGLAVTAQWFCQDRGRDQGRSQRQDIK